MIHCRAQFPNATVRGDLAVSGESVQLYAFLQAMSEAKGNQLDKFKAAAESVQF